MYDLKKALREAANSRLVDKRRFLKDVTSNRYLSDDYQ